jgi:hypothetical protein
MNARHHLLRALRFAALLGVLEVALGCSGPDFQAGAPSDAATAGEDDSDDLAPIICTACGDPNAPADAGANSRDATIARADGDGDGADETAGQSDGPGDDGDASESGVCSSTELLCDGGCIPSGPRHCGACGNDCTNLPNVSGTTTCASGHCSFPQSSCAAGWADCNGITSDGCETNITTATHCGGCTNACIGTAAVCSVSGGSYSCVSGCSSSSPTLCGTTCADTTTSANNCKTCGNVCTTSVSNAQATCVMSACTFTCNSGYAACNAGCVDTAGDSANCGGCGGAYACTGGKTCQSGVCACPAGQTFCGSTCVSLATDANNCGACGHGCLGGVCSGSLCQPVVIGSTSGIGVAITVDLGRVYWITSGTSSQSATLYACPKTGCIGTPNALVSSPGTLTNVLYDSTTGALLATEQSRNAVDRYDTAGTLLAQITNQSSVGPLALDQNYVYWGFNGGIARSTKYLAAPTVIANAPNLLISSLGIDPSDSTIYGAVFANTGTIISASTSSTGAWSALVGPNEPNPDAIVVTSNTVYWMNRGTAATMFADGGLYLCPSSGCTQPVLASNRPLPVGDNLIGDQNYLYFMGDSALYRCDIGQCNATTTQLTSIAQGIESGPTITQDATALYWVDFSGVVTRLAK